MILLGHYGLSSLCSPFAGNVPPSPQLADTRLRWRKDQTQWRQERDRDGERVKAFSEPDFLVLGNLASEVSMVTIDMLEIVIKVSGVWGWRIDPIISKFWS